MISIIIPNFNRAEYLKETLDSVINQDNPNWEALVVDDGSTDNSKEIVTELAKNYENINWVERTSKIKGAPACRNLGLKLAKGDYIIFLDSDDLLAPNCVSQRLEIMQSNPGLDFAVFQMQFFVKKTGDDKRLWNKDTGKDIIKRFLNLDAVWQTTGPIWKKSALEQIGGFNEDLKCWQDVELHLKALLKGLNYQLFFDKPVDCHYRKGSVESISQSNTNSLPKLESKAILYHWVTNRIGNTDYHSDQMAKSIAISAINGHQFSFFKRFLKTVKGNIDRSVYKQIQYLYFLEVSRLTRLSVFKKIYNQKKSKLINGNSIGVFTN